LGLAGATAEPATEHKVKLNKKGHSVRFRDVVPDGGALEDVKLFKEEMWELEMPFWKVDDVGFPYFWASATCAEPAGRAWPLDARSRSR
jgi:hypothetical protein